MRWTVLAALPLAELCWSDPPSEPEDGDGDGVGSLRDCDDGDDAVHPGAEEVPGNCLDEDCDGYLDPGDAAPFLDEGGSLLCGQGQERMGWALASGGAGADASLLAGSPVHDGGGGAYVVPIAALAQVDAGDLVPIAELAQATLAGPDYSEAGTGVAEGDVDGDGATDVVVGAPGESSAGWSSVGSASVLLGPVRGELSLSDADLRMAGDDDSELRLGHRLAVADLDGDGAGDVAAAAPGWGEAAGTIAWILNVAGGEAGDRALDDADLLLRGAEWWDGVGEAIAAGGDVDGDGLEDLLVGAPGLDVGAAEGGGLYVQTGGLPAGDDGSLLLEDVASLAYGEAALLHAGVTVASAGDLDEDGLDDALVGTACEGRSCDARADIVLGEVDFASRSLAAADARVRWIADDDQAPSFSILDAKVLLLGRPDAGQSRTGGAWLVELAIGATVDVEDAQLLMTGEHPGNRMGQAVAPDVDGRVAVSAPGRDREGALYLASPVW